VDVDDKIVIVQSPAKLKTSQNFSQNLHLLTCIVLSLVPPLHSRNNLRNGEQNEFDNFVFTNLVQHCKCFPTKKFEASKSCWTNSTKTKNLWKELSLWPSVGKLPKDMFNTWNSVNNKQAFCCEETRRVIYIFALIILLKSKHNFILQAK